MKWIFLVFLLVANVLYAQKIIWREDSKLVWDNFRSKVNNQQGTDIIAYTNCGWVYSVVKSSNPKSPVKIKIETVFNEEKSWKDSKRINEYVLAHEQRHFDVAEVYARKLRKEVAEKIKTSGDYSKNFQAIYDRILKEYKNFQIAYDKETNHGMNEEKQAEYNLKIAAELDHLKSYKTS